MNKNVFVFSVLFVFMAGLVYGAQLPVELGTSGDFVILAKSGISTTGVTAITGDIGVSPISSVAITGFDLVRVGTYATSSLVNGSVYASNYDSPTPSKMTTAVGDMHTAYVDAMGRPTPDETNLGAGNLGGLTLNAGLYKFTTGVTIPTELTLNGSSSDVFIFQIDGTLDISSATNVTLIGGVNPDNIFWAVAGETDLGTTSSFKGNILCENSLGLHLRTGAILEGRALSSFDVTLDANDVSLPAGVEIPAPVLPVQGRGISGGSGSTLIPQTVLPTESAPVGATKHSFLYNLWHNNSAYIIGFGALALLLGIMAMVFKGKPTKKG